MSTWILFRVFVIVAIIISIVILSFRWHIVSFSSGKMNIRNECAQRWRNNKIKIIQFSMWRWAKSKSTKICTHLMRKKKRHWRNFHCNIQVILWKQIRLQRRHKNDYYSRYAKQQKIQLNAEANKKKLLKIKSFYFEWDTKMLRRILRIMIPQNQILIKNNSSNVIFGCSKFPRRIACNPVYCKLTEFSFSLRLI